jgi:hypothetical protein
MKPGHRFPAHEIPDIAAKSGIIRPAIPTLNGSKCANEHFSGCFRQPDTGIFYHLVALTRCQGNGGVETAAHTPQPTLGSPAGKHLGGLHAANAERRHRIVDRDEFAPLPEDDGKSGSAFLWWFGCRHCNTHPTLIHG